MLIQIFDSVGTPWEVRPHHAKALLALQSGWSLTAQIDVEVAPEVVAQIDERDHD